MYYSRTELELLYHLLGAQNRCPIMEANLISLVYLNVSVTHGLTLNTMYKRMWVWEEVLYEALVCVIYIMGEVLFFFGVYI